MTRRVPVLTLAGVTALVLVGLAVATPQLLEQLDVADPRPTLDAVVVHDDLRTDHVDDEVEYEQAPPPGGPHDPTWLACGEYDDPVRDENMVHSLEHGTVWLTYRDLSADEVSDLATQLPEEGVLSPYPDQEAPVVVTVWGRQLELDGADDPRLPLFLLEYGDGHTSPEPMASCAGGERILDSVSSVAT